MGEDKNKDEKLETLILKYLRKLDEKDYKHLLHEVFFIVHDGHFTKSMAEYAVRKMRNTDGSTGEKMSMENVKNLIAQCKMTVHEYDFYYVINMMYSDYAGVFGNNPHMYVKAALAYLNDPDAKKGKALRQFLNEKEV